MKLNIAFGRRIGIVWAAVACGAFGEAVQANPLPMDIGSFSGFCQPPEPLTKPALEERIQRIQNTLAKLRKEKEACIEAFHTQKKSISTSLSTLYFASQVNEKDIITHNYKPLYEDYAAAFARNLITYFDKIEAAFKKSLENLEKIEENLAQELKETSKKLETLEMKARKTIAHTQAEVQELLKTETATAAGNELKVSLEMPVVNGKVLKTPTHKTKKYQGVHIQTDFSAEVLAPGYGTVTYSGPLGAISWAVIINHGMGYSSLLSGFETAEIAIDTALYPGQTIAKMPGYGGKKPVLIFEFRGKEGPVDPLKFIRQ